MMNFRHHNWLPHSFWQELRFFSDDFKGILFVATAVFIVSAWICRKAGMGWGLFTLRAGLTLAAIGVSDLVAYRVFKVSFGRLKPDVVAFDANSIQPLSFPSSHAFNCLFICFFLFFWSSPMIRKQWAFLWFFGLLFGIFVGLSRIYWLVHFPSDVFAGWTLGAILGAFAGKILQTKAGQLGRPEASL